MKEIKKSKGFNKHLRYFIALATGIFTIVGISHLCILIKGISLNIDGIILPQSVSYFVIFISLMMVIMGCYYYKAIGEDK